YINFETPFIKTKDMMLFIFYVKAYVKENIF
ncbi:hypothetical protein, partial [Plasmodium yoelii yoelii]